MVFRKLDNKQIMEPIPYTTPHKNEFIIMTQI